MLSRLHAGIGISEGLGRVRKKNCGRVRVGFRFGQAIVVTLGALIVAHLDFVEEPERSLQCEGYIELW